MGRYLLSGLVQDWTKRDDFPVGTLAVNVVGCLVIGVLSQLVEARGRSQPHFVDVRAQPELEGDEREELQLSLGGGRKLELSLNVFNTLNRTNLLSNVNSSIITNALAPNFAQIQSAYPKRQAQLGVRFTF